MTIASSRVPRASASSQHLRAFVCTIFILATSSSALAAPVLQFYFGELFGASGVDVDGVLYDVTFVDGTCASLFTGCDDAADFTFTTQASALAASHALLAQVFVDGPVGNFDSQPIQTNHCRISLFCEVLTPFAIAGVGLVATGVASNYAGPDSLFAADHVSTSVWNVLTNTMIDPATSDAYVFATWTAQASPVPEPSTLFLVATGLVVGIGGWRRRRRSSTDQRFGTARLVTRRVHMSPPCVRGLGRR